MIENALVDCHLRSIQVLKNLSTDVSENSSKKIVDLNRVSVGRGRGRIPTTSNSIHFSNRLQTNSNKYRLNSSEKSDQRSSKSTLIKYSCSKSFNSQQVSLQKFDLEITFFRVFTFLR